MHPEDSWLWHQIRKFVKRLRKLGFWPAIFIAFVVSGCSPSILPEDPHVQMKIYKLAKDFVGAFVDLSNAAMIAAKAYESQVAIK